jgi:integrase
MSKAHLKLVTPAIVKRTVMPTRLPNGDLRSREYLTETEVERLMAAARKNRWGHRDATMILTAFRHGFRPAELVDLRWEQIEFASGAMHHPKGQARDTKHPSNHWRRTTGAKASSARAGAQVALRIHVGARRAFRYRGLRSDG